MDPSIGADDAWLSHTKRGMFGLFHSMTERSSRERITLRAHVVALGLLCVDAVQVMALQVSPTFGWSPDALGWIQSFSILDLLLPVRDPELFNVVYTVVFLACAVSVANVIFVAYMYRSGEFRHIWTLRVLRVAVAAFVTAGFVPTFGILAVPFSCAAMQRYNGADLACDGVQAVAMMAASTVVLMGFLPFGIATSAVYFNNSPASADVTSRTSGYEATYGILAKITCVIGLHVASAHPAPVAFVNMVVYGGLLLHVVATLPFYHMPMNYMRCGVTAATFALCVGSFIHAVVALPVASDKTAAASVDTVTLSIVCVLQSVMFGVMGALAPRLRRKLLLNRLHHIIPRVDRELLAENGAELTALTGSHVTTTVDDFSTVSEVRSRDSDAVRPLRARLSAVGSTHTSSASGALLSPIDRGRHEADTTLPTTDVTSPIDGRSPPALQDDARWIRENALDVKRYTSVRRLPGRKTGHTPKFAHVARRARARVAAVNVLKMHDRLADTRYKSSHRLVADAFPSTASGEELRRAPGEEQRRASMATRRAVVDDARILEEAGDIDSVHGAGSSDDGGADDELAQQLRERELDAAIHKAESDALFDGLQVYEVELLVRFMLESDDPDIVIANSRFFDVCFCRRRNLVLTRMAVERIIWMFTRMALESTHDWAALAAAKAYYARYVTEFTRIEQLMIPSIDEAEREEQPLARQFELFSRRQTLLQSRQRHNTGSERAVDAIALAETTQRIQSAVDNHRNALVALRGFARTARRARERGKIDVDDDSLAERFGAYLDVIGRAGHESLALYVKLATSMTMRQKLFPVVKNLCRWVLNDATRAELFRPDSSEMPPGSGGTTVASGTTRSTPSVATAAFGTPNGGGKSVPRDQTGSVAVARRHYQLGIGFLILLIVGISTITQSVIGDLQSDLRVVSAIGDLRVDCVAASQGARDALLGRPNATADAAQHLYDFRARITAYGSPISGIMHTNASWNERSISVLRRLPPRVDRGSVGVNVSLSRRELLHELCDVGETGNGIGWDWPALMFRFENGVTRALPSMREATRAFMVASEAALQRMVTVQITMLALSVAIITVLLGCVYRSSARRAIEVKRSVNTFVNLMPLSELHRMCRAVDTAHREFEQARVLLGGDAETEDAERGLIVEKDFRVDHDDSDAAAAGDTAAASGTPATAAAGTTATAAAGTTATAAAGTTATAAAGTTAAAVGSMAVPVALFAADGDTSAAKLGTDGEEEEKGSDSPGAYSGSADGHSRIADAGVGDSRDNTSLASGEHAALLHAVSSVDHEEQPLSARPDALARLVRQSTESMSATLVVANKHGIIQHVNGACEGLTGWSRAELLGENVKLLVPHDLAPKHDALLTRIVPKSEGGRGEAPRVIGQLGRQHMMRHRSGRALAVMLTLTQTCFEGATYFIANIQDLSAAREADDSDDDDEDADHQQQHTNRHRRQQCRVMAVLFLVLALQAVGVALGRLGADMMQQRSREVDTVATVGNLARLITFEAQELAFGARSDSQLWSDDETAHRLRDHLAEIYALRHALHFGNATLQLPGSSGRTRTLDQLHFGHVGSDGARGLDSILSEFEELGGRLLYLWHTDDGANDPDGGFAEACSSNTQDTLNGTTLDVYILTERMRCLHRAEIAPATLSSMGLLTSSSDEVARAARTADVALAAGNIALITLLFAIVFRRIVNRMLTEARRGSILLQLIPAHLARRNFRRYFTRVQ